MLRPRRLLECLLSLSLTLPAGLAAASPPDPPDFEVVTPTPAPAAAAPVGLGASPLNVTGTARGGPRRRFVLRDGSVLVAQVLGFDGNMYALRLPHGTLLAREDVFSAITPVPRASAPAGIARPRRTRSHQWAPASRPRLL